MRVRKRLALVGMVALAACGGAPPAPKHVDLPGTVARADFGAFTLDAARAMQDALAGRAPAAYLTCDAPDDVRATTAIARQKIAQLGPETAIVMAGIKVSLYARAGNGVDPSEARDVPGKPLTVFVNGRTVIGPNGRVAWAEMEAHDASVEEPQEDRVDLDTLAPPLKNGLTEALAALSPNTCNIHLLSSGDITDLPYDMPKDERDVVLMGMRVVLAGMPRACHAVGGVPSGVGAEHAWSVHFHHVDLVLSGSGMLARVRSRLTLAHASSPCLGAVEVEKIVSGG